MKKGFFSRNVQVIIVDPSNSLTHPESLTHSDITYLQSLAQVSKSLKSGVIIFDVFTDSHDPKTLATTKLHIQRIKKHFGGLLIGMGRYDGRALPDSDLGELMKDIHGYVGTEYFQTDMNNLLGGLQMVHEMIINRTEVVRTEDNDPLRDIMIKVNYLFLKRYFDSLIIKPEKVDVFIGTQGGFEILHPGDDYELFHNRPGIIASCNNTILKKETKHHYKPLPKEFEFSEFLQHANN